MRYTRLLSLLFLSALMFAISRDAQAQSWDWNRDAARAQFQSFNVFMQNHPWIAKKLWEKPERVNDRDFVNDNKELKQWLEDHPAAAGAFHEDPAGFMERERHFEVYGRDFSAGNGLRSELARFDWFLDGHPDIRHDLVRHPRLVDDGRYLDRHPDLSEFLYRHPEVRSELEEHPRDFMAREGRY